MTSFGKTLADANRTPPHSPAVPFPALMPFLMFFPVYLFVCVHMQAHLRVHGEVRGLVGQIQILRLGVQCFCPLSILSKPFYDLELNLIQPKPVLAFQCSCLQASMVFLIWFWRLPWIKAVRSSSCEMSTAKSHLVNSVE